MPERRPNPDNLLKQAQEEERQHKRSKLKIYLGAAPGVGKTYQMLHDAQIERENGLDVVVGVVETHGRQEIESLIVGTEILPKQKIDYHGKQLEEFDLEGALRRRPALILIDEMAHSNVPGVRHKKRWQDIKELLDRGIDVYTTLNVQHIESLNDHASQIIHAPIKETVPDSMIEMADTIELIDLPPEQLLKRLQEGKVYVPQQASLAAEHFFRKGNLIALRELALRTTAERVGDQVLLYRQGQGIKHIWPSKEKILVCVGSGTDSVKLIYAAKRMATSFQTEWIAVYIDRPWVKSSEMKRNLAIQNLRIAERLGAETRVLTGMDIVKEIMNFAHENNVTQIMVWKHIRRRLRDFVFRSLADEIVRYSGEIDVYIMTRSSEDVNKRELVFLKKPTAWWGYLVSFTMVSVVTIINSIICPYVKTNNLIMFYLLGITVVSLMGQAGPAILASILSVIFYNYFLVTPYYTFPIEDGQSLVSLLVMLVVSQVISNLTILTRRQAEVAQLAQHHTTTLYTLSRQLASTRGLDKLLNAGISYIGNVFGSEVLALLPENGRLVIRARYRTEQILDEKELGVAQWVFELGQMAGTDSLSFSDALYFPLLGSQGVIGVLRIHPDNVDHLVSPEQMHLLEACVNQIALALEVDRLQEKSRKSELKTESDRVRSALLQAVSHDLRAPLVAIIGAASTQIEMAKNLSAMATEKLGREIYTEAEQLSRLINNLLQITYMEAEQVKLQKKLLSIEDLITLVVKISSKKLLKRSVNIEASDHLPLVPFDNTLLQEVLLNLIDNAVKFTPDKTPIDISVVAEKNRVIVSVRDHGPGIMPDEVNRLFEKFYRGRMLSEARGLGLGLALCRNIIKAHGGEIWAENNPDSGAVFRFTLPL